MSNTWTSLLDIVYPVGSLYVSYKTTSPATLFGGTWTTVSGFPWLHTSKTVGTTGGEETHTLTLNEMPSHTHNGSTNWNWSVSPGANTGEYHIAPIDGSWGNAIQYGDNWRGSSAAHNNLPPYFVLRGWRRTA